jgi:hypothetical protein
MKNGDDYATHPAQLLGVINTSIAVTGEDMGFMMLGIGIVLAGDESSRLRLLRMADALPEGKKRMRTFYRRVERELGALILSTGNKDLIDDNADLLTSVVLHTWQPPHREDSQNQEGEHE